MSPTVRRTWVVAFAATLTTVALWGSAFVAIRDAGRALTPGSLALGRLLRNKAASAGVGFACHGRTSLTPSSRQKS